MNRHVNAIAGRLSLRQPQRRSLEILDRITEIAPPKRGVELQAALDAIRSEHPSVTDFEREFPSLCFALATGVGKTRLMGAFISYLHLAHGFSNFFVLAPNLTIYNKLTTDFTPNTPKYVFKGIAEFSTESPVIVTGDTYEQGAGVRTGMLPGYEHEVHINIFNISKINSEVRGGKSPRIKRLSEYIGQSYFDYLAGLEDLVLIMDESHRYRASAGVRAINELKPVLGLELTATPFVETSKGPVPFKNVIYDYPLGRAMADGFVKEPAVVTRKNFNPAGMTPEEIERLLRVEHTDEPTEIVIHVNMLKEGWDVTNLYTIVPLRAANARILIEQSIGRGLRLPYGRRTGVTAVDRLNIVAHDRFQEIIDEANRPDSPIRVQAVALDPDHLGQRTVTVVSQSQLASTLGLTPAQVTSSTAVAGAGEAPAFTNPDEQKVAQIAYAAICRLENQPKTLPSVTYLRRPEIQAALVHEVAAQYRPAQLAMEAIVEAPDIPSVVARTTELVVRQTIGIPRILVVPQGEVRSGFKPFQLRLETLRYPAVSEELWVQYLRTGGTETVALGRGGIEEARLEDYIVSGLVDFDDISYDDHADLLYDLAGQTVGHLRSYLSEDETTKVLRCYQRDIARFIHAQMQEHYWEEAVGYEVKISKGFTELKPSAYSAVAGEACLDFRQAPADKGNIAENMTLEVLARQYVVE